MKKRLARIGYIVAVFSMVFVGGANTFAASTPTMNQTINAGVLTTDILDASRNPVASPSVTMSAKSFTFDCQQGANASTGTFGSNTNRIYVTNPGGANNGWTLTIGATSGATALWANAGATQTFDFNDGTGSGCTDGADADSKAGQLSIDPSVSTLTTDCASCTTANVSKGSSSSFVQGTTDSITLLSASSAANSNWRGYLTGAALSQTIPAEQPATAYTLGLTLTTTAL